MRPLRSYVGGAWVAPAGDGRPAFDAVTGEEVATDLVGRHRHGRRRWNTGGAPAARRCAS